MKPFVKKALWGVAITFNALTLVDGVRSTYYAKELPTFSGSDSSSRTTAILENLFHGAVFAIRSVSTNQSPYSVFALDKTLGDGFSADFARSGLYVLADTAGLPGELAGDGIGRFARAIGGSHKFSTPSFGSKK